MLLFSTGNVLRSSKFSRQPTVLNILSEKQKRKKMKHQPTSCIVRKTDLIKDVFSLSCSRNHVYNGGYHGNSNENWYCVVEAHGDRFIRMACHNFCHDTAADFIHCGKTFERRTFELKNCFQALTGSTPKLASL